MFQKSCFIFFNKRLKNDKNVFHFTFSFLRYVDFCPDLSGHVVKGLIKKAKVNFKIYDVIYWGINNYKIHVA